jgi:hypothetical protein
MLMLMSNVNVALFDQDDGFKRLPAAYLMIFLTYTTSHNQYYILMARKINLDLAIEDKIDDCIFSLTWNDR